MAAGDRNKSGKPTDIVRHFWAPITEERDRFNERISKTMCGRKDVGYCSSDVEDVTCLRCLSKIKAEKEE